MNKIVLFLDIDGVLNQYRICERIKRNKRVGWSNAFNPFPKKVKRLAKLIKKYNLDVYVFSAWTQNKLQQHLPFKLKGDTGKYAVRVEEIIKKYDKALLIDDELINNLYGHERKEIPENLNTYQPNYNFGLVLKDFKKIDNILKQLKE